MRADKNPIGDIVALWQGKSKKRYTGGRLVRSRGKRRFEIGSEAHPAVLGQPSKKFMRTRGANRKQRALAANEVNITDPKTHKTVKTRIITVVENPANPHYVRRNIITKGTVVETEMGNVRITSRPGQHGVINGVLVGKK
jgi:small subunit ribosomal protein S8e